MCVDSRQIKLITVKYQFSILTFQDLFDQLDSACFFFFRIDLCSGYY